MTHAADDILIVMTRLPRAGRSKTRLISGDAAGWMVTKAGRTLRQADPPGAGEGIRPPTIRTSLRIVFPGPVAADRPSPVRGPPAVARKSVLRFRNRIPSLKFDAEGCRGATEAEQRLGELFRELIEEP